MGKKEKRDKNIRLGKLLDKIKVYGEEDATYSFKEMVFIMVFSLGIGFFSCFVLCLIFMGGKNYHVLSKDLSKLVDTYYALTDNYYEKIDKDVLVEDAIKGMMSSVGDSYTNYSDTNTTNDFLETVNGSYEGIGCTVGKKTDNKLIVVQVFKDGAADKAGIRENDIILKVDGEDYSDKTPTDMAEHIKSIKGDSVTLLIERDNEEKEVIIKISKVEMPTVESKVIERNDKKIGYISISLFTSITTKQFKSALDELNKEKVEGLVIDVRDNAGGFLSVVSDISSIILPKNKVIYKLEKDKHISEIKDSTKEHLSYPVAVLVNSNSASASEILASAIKESYNGFVVGTNTFGKGTVQQTTTLPDGSMVKYTVQKWLTPNDNWINDKGVEPTNKVELNKEYFSNPIMENDNQLSTALDLVSNK